MNQQRNYSCWTDIDEAEMLIGRTCYNPNEAYSGAVLGQSETRAACRNEGAKRFRKRANS